MTLTPSSSPQVASSRAVASGSWGMREVSRSAGDWLLANAFLSQ